MTFPTEITATHFAQIMVSREPVPVASSRTEAGLKALFTGITSTGEYVTIEHVRDLPAIGTPPSLVNVPEYGLAQSLKVGVQADAPDLELTLNFVATQWKKAGATFATTGTLGDLKDEGTPVVFQLVLAGAKPASYNCTAAGLGTVPNILFYWVGRIEAYSVQAARDDAATATVSLSLLSDFYGPFTIDPAE